MLAVRMILDGDLKHLRILLSLNEEGFLNAVHENCEVEASTQAGTSIENDTLFDDEENNPIGMYETQLIYNLGISWNLKMINYI